MIFKCKDTLLNSTFDLSGVICELLDKSAKILYTGIMKNLRFLLLGFLVLLCLHGKASAGEVWGARFPAPSPDGRKISFSYYGDIWIVDSGGGKAERLTDSEGYESRSFWSPDGKWIAFETDRWGNEDICVISSDGSEPPKRLSYYSTTDILYGWTPDGNYILFSSRRNTFASALYKISIKGGLPIQITDFRTQEVCFLADGKKFYYVRGGSAWWRRKYRGGTDSEIWFKSLTDGKSQRITNSEGRDSYPMYSEIDQKLYFLSNRGKNLTNNIWRAKSDGTLPEQISFETEDIHFPEMSFDGRNVVYECFGNLYIYEIETAEKSKINIKVTEDYKVNRQNLMVFSKDASEFALSPDEKEIAFSVHGDIFVLQIKKGYKVGKIARVTNTPYVEKYVSWHPDKEMLLYSSMKDGDMDIYTIEPENEKKFYDELTFDSRKISDSDGTEIKPVFSPDGKKIVYLRNNRELHIMDDKGKNSRKLCPENEVLWFSWSPDSKWVTFSRTVLGFREDIFVVPADGSKQPINISNHPNDDYKPMWSADGRRIAFASRNATGDLWMKYIFLKKEDEERDDEYWENTEEDSVSKSVEVSIDFQDIEERTHTVTKMSGYYNYVAQSADGKQFAIHSESQGKNDIWTIDWRGKQLKRVTKANVNPTMFFVSEDRKSVYYLSGEGRISNAEIATAESKPLRFSVEMEVDRNKEREQVFNEAWWALQDGFYDSNFHGIDWQDMYIKYKNFALHMRTSRGFNSVVSMMIGELNASHLGVWKREGKSETTGALGIIYDFEYKGKGVKIKDMVPESPIAGNKFGIKKGDIITFINGKEIDQGKNFYSLLRRKNGKDIKLRIFSEGKSREIKIEPKDPGAILKLVEKNWVSQNKDFVHNTTNGKLGYLYISGMGGWNLRTFKKDLYKEMGRDGLIIDIRYNGGGHIHDELLTILRRTTPYAYSVKRGGKKEYSSLFRYDKPTIMLINEYCYSDAEIFPSAFKELGLGKVVGVPTFGAVIGTNNIRLLDGTIFRVPGTGWFRVNGRSLENSPVEPDIYVANTPEMDGKVSDNQLKRAIEELLREIK